MTAGSASDFVEIDELVVHYDRVLAVDGVSFAVAKGEHLTLLGPSGCGKTTILRAIAGLETPTSGEIRIDGQVVFSSRRGADVPAEKRRLSMVFQSYAIWPHMTIFDNVAYGLSLRHVGRDETRAAVGRVLRMVGMAEFADRDASKLSGGQQQRVAVARSIAFQPRFLLMDEPLSNLDARLRVQMREELKDLQRQLGVTTLYVTHDQEEALALSDRIIVMRAGRIEQEGSPAEIYNAPRTAFVANFVGAANIIEGRLVTDGAGTARLEAAGGVVLECDAPASPAPANGRCAASVRTVYPRLARVAGGGVNTWPGTIKRRTFLGDTVLYRVAWGAGELQVRTPPTDVYEEGDAVFVSIDPCHVSLLAASVGAEAGP